MAPAAPVSASAATDATDAADAADAANAANAANAALPPPPVRQKARAFVDLAEEDEARLLALVTLRKPNLAFAARAAHALRPETRRAAPDDPELARRCQGAWLTLFQEAASSDGARQELRDTLDAHLTGKPPPIPKSWSMRAEEAEIEEWYEDAARETWKDELGPNFPTEAARGRSVNTCCADLEQESFYSDKRRLVDTGPFMEQYGRVLAVLGGRADGSADPVPKVRREHECPVQAWRQLLQDAPHKGFFAFEVAKLKLEDEERWACLEAMPLDEVDGLLFALTDAHGPTQFELEWYGEDARDQAKRVVTEFFVGAEDGNAVRACFDAADAGDAACRVIQGGVLFSGGHARRLTAKLDAHRYDCSSDKFAAYLFCNRAGHWEAAAFGLQTFPSVGHFGSYNITPVPLHDPTPDKPWDKEALKVFYSLVDDARDQLAAGKIVVVACMMGKNRSKAVLHALNPTPANAPTCDSMRRAAEGYRNDKDLSIAPLKPERASRKRTR
jgi:hypothetical protein